MKYTNGGTGISDCGTINFAGNSTIQIDFYMNINSSTLSVNPPIQYNSNFRIYTKKTVSSTPIQYGPWDYSFNWSWNPLTGYYLGKPTKWAASTGTTYVTLKASDFNNTDGKLYISVKDANNVEYKSCEYSIVNKIPIFAISPNMVNMPCGSTSPVKLTVNSDYGTPGTLTYNWNVGNGWNLSPGTYPTSNNSFELIPTGYSYSDVSVTPILNGVAQPTNTATVNLAPFTSAATITGQDLICAPSTSGVYSISGLATGQNVTWSSSNTSIATVSSTIGNTIDVNKVGTGTFNLIATITNTCGQSINVTKSITIYTITSIPIPSGYFSVNGIDCNNDGPLPIIYTPDIPFSGIITISPSLLAHSLRTQTRNITVKYTNPCTGEYETKIITYNYTAPNCNTAKMNNNNIIYSIYPNPSNEIVNIELKDKSNLPTRDTAILGELFDMMGQSISKIQISDNKATFSIRGLKKGVYILKISINDKIETHQIVVE